MDFIKIDKKWQERWEKQEAFKFNEKNIDKKWYVLEMFSYPSGAKLHVGHWYNYGPSDSYARFKRMKGFEVFQPMGFDAFGLPAENYAIKTGIHPKTSTLKNIKTMEKQLRSIGATFNWENEVVTCDPDYYKWTQWLFLQFYKNGLAYRKEAPVNWCPSCHTVLANEQVVDGSCERCKSTVIHKNLVQWFFKITKYAEELLSDLDKLDWPHKTVAMQKNWIGKSTGSEIIFKTENGQSFRTFTTRADTLFGVSYVVLAPEHSLVKQLTTKDKQKEVDKYIEKCSKIDEIERLSTTREKTGVFIGAYAINPINNKKVPIFISDYVLASYGTGAVMGVPAHDERDFLFAKKYNQLITTVITHSDFKDVVPYCEDGVLVNSDKYTGLTSAKARKAIVKDLQAKGAGEFKTNYRLRDWLVSRQRYWGAPIPIIHCDKCGAVPVPEDQLPVILPDNVDFTPDGKSPLAKSEEFINTTCPKCSAPAKREVDTLDTFVCSSWYQFRYVDPHNNKIAFDRQKVNKMLPVDKYIGGAEHACMHLLYARFFTKALRDMGYLDFDEPFMSLIHQGTILGPDGNKMSKSRGNIVSPDEFISQYGSDVFRMYLMFGFNYIDGGPWSDGGIKAVCRFLERVERIVLKAKEIKTQNFTLTPAEKELLFIRHSTIKGVSEDMDKFSFNTAIAKIMELTNSLYKYEQDNPKKHSVFYDTVVDLIKLLSPLAPHISEELNEILGFSDDFISNIAYPEYDEKYLVKDEIEIAIQINSKIKGKMHIPSDITNKDLEELVLKSDIITASIGDKKVVKCIIIPKRLVNVVIK